MLPKSLFVTGLAALLVLSACTFTVQPEMDAAPPAPAEAPAEPAQPEEIQPEEIQPSLQAAFILPDGNRCLFAGTGATMAFDGKRVNYTCDVAPEGKIVAILDDPVQPETGLTEWQVEVAVISPGSEGFTLDSSEVIQFTAWQIDLAGDVTCLHAGFGPPSASTTRRQLHLRTGHGGCNRPDSRRLPCAPGAAGQRARASGTRTWLRRAAPTTAGKCWTTPR